MLSNIVLAGGNTMFDGYGQRLWHEINICQEIPTRIKILSSPDRDLSVWKGGAELSSLSTFQPMWITKAEFEEFGSSIVLRK
jgi:actin, other eukaryote